MACVVAVPSTDAVRVCSNRSQFGPVCSTLPDEDGCPGCTRARASGREALDERPFGRLIREIAASHTKAVGMYVRRALQDVHIVARYHCEA